MRTKEKIGDEWEDIIKNNPKVSDDAAVLSAALMHINESLIDIRDILADKNRVINVAALTGPLV